MASSKRKWLYVDERTETQVGPVTRVELDAAYRDGAFGEFAYVADVDMPRDRGGDQLTGIPYSSLVAQTSVDVCPSIEEFWTSRRDQPTTILSGANNTGKTQILKQLLPLIGHQAYFLACARFSHLDVLNSRQKDPLEKRRVFQNFVQNQHMAQQNSDNNDRSLDQVIAGLKDEPRDRLLTIAGDLLDSKFQLLHTEDDNKLSPFYIDMDGQNLKYASAGTRLLFVLLGNMLDGDYSTLLIDEPELGLSPKIQTVFAQRIHDPVFRAEFFPHLKQVFIATHSHIFLDRRVISNNFRVTKSGNTVAVQPLGSVAELHHLQFSMLGNDLESMFLPAVIIIVEGECDQTFLSKICELHMPDRKVSIVPAFGDGRVPEKVNTIVEAFGDLRTSPYQSRLFVVLDQRRSVRRSQIENVGVLPANIHVWSLNGIEYFYPIAIVAAAFRCAVGQVKDIDLSQDYIEFNGVRLSKKALAKEVTVELTTKHELHPELQKLLDIVRESCKN